MGAEHLERWRITAENARAMALRSAEARRRNRDIRRAEKARLKAANAVGELPQLALQMVAKLGNEAKRTSDPRKLSAIARALIDWRGLAPEQRQAARRIVPVVP